VRALVLAAILALPAGAASPNVKVRVGKSVAEFPLERYVAAVMAGESSVFQSQEALKAMSVAARTYAVRLRGRHSAEGFDFCDTAHCQRVDLTTAAARMEAIAAATAGELLWFDGKPAFTPYTGDCGGRTEDAAAAWPDLAAPYLKSRADEYCGRAGESGWKWDPRGEEIAVVLRRAGLTTPQVLERISIVDRTPGGRARTLLLAGRGWPVRISASSFRFAIGRELGWNSLRSDRYSVYSAVGRLSFDGAGAGHGVGLCQRGAEQMGRDRRT
jgi:stage II sporulation protein D